MNILIRNYQKLKTISDYQKLDEPTLILSNDEVTCPFESQMILRMLVRPKYGGFFIPVELAWLREKIIFASTIDSYYTGIMHSWCYVTVRHGPVTSVTDDEWHFDGASFRTDIIPERNYVWMNHTPFQYKVGSLNIPEAFDPCKYDLFSFASRQLEDAPIQTVEAKSWYLINPFCLHRRNPEIPEGSRTFIRISFPDIEGRDINNTHNPLLPTPFFGRDPVKSFRNNLLKWKS